MEKLENSIQFELSRTESKLDKIPATNKIRSIRMTNEKTTYRDIIIGNSVAGRFTTNFQKNRTIRDCEVVKELIVALIKSSMILDMEKPSHNHKSNLNNTNSKLRIEMNK